MWSIQRLSVPTIVRPGQYVAYKYGGIAVAGTLIYSVAVAYGRLYFMTKHEDSNLHLNIHVMPLPVAHMDVKHTGADGKPLYRAKHPVPIRHTSWGISAPSGCILAEITNEGISRWQ